MQAEERHKISEAVAAALRKLPGAFDDVPSVEDAPFRAAPCAASADSLELLAEVQQRGDGGLVGAVCFDETLMVMNSADEPLGYAYIDVAAHEHEGEPCYRVSCLSVADISPDVRVESSMEALVRCNLETIWHQQRQSVRGPIATGGAAGSGDGASGGAPSGAAAAAGGAASAESKAEAGAEVEAPAAGAAAADAPAAGEVAAGDGGGGGGRRSAVQCRTMRVKHDVAGERYVIEDDLDGMRTRASYAAADMRGLITETADKVLQRLLAIVHLTPSHPLHLLGLFPSGQPAAAVYSALPSDALRLAGADTHHALVIRRQLHTPPPTAGDEGGRPATASAVAPDDAAQTWVSHCLNSGRCARRAQEGSPLFLVLSDGSLSSGSYEGLPATGSLDSDAESDYDVEQDPLYALPARPAPKERTWEDDMELMSKFIEEKQRIKDDHLFYIRQHPELQALLKDFMKLLMHKKPEDVYLAASEFFSTFSSQ